jgi:hypothetical protein
MRLPGRLLDTEFQAKNICGIVNVAFIWRRHCAIAPKQFNVLSRLGCSHPKPFREVLLEVTAGGSL